VAELDLSRRIVHQVEGMTRVHAERGIVYRRDDGAELLMDIYRPREIGPGVRLPAIVFVPGGPIPRAMLPQREWGFFISYGELAAASGFAGVTFNHRLHAPTDYDTAQSDVSAAIRYLCEHARALGVDGERLALWAFSGGGPLLSEYFRACPPHIRCLLAFYAVLDLRPLLTPDADPARIERVLRLSPAAHLAGATVPIFVARAGVDTMVNPSLDAFVTEALSKNVPLELMNHPTGQHAFDVLDDNERSRQIIARAVEFARAHLTE
jgi:acetyl esterase/lipase